MTVDQAVKKFKLEPLNVYTAKAKAKELNVEEVLYMNVQKNKYAYIVKDGARGYVLYQDEKNYCSVAYVAMANWTDRYEYAITLDDSNTIIYVYLQNMDAKDIHMQADYLPKYFQDNNAGKHQDTDPMTADYRSFYAFRIGDHYIDCMDLADQIEIADTEPKIQAEDVAQEVESN